MENIDQDTTTILIVDDNAANRLLLSSQLEMEGYSIIQAVNGVEGIEVAEAELPDLILLDLNLPKRDGREVLKEIKMVFCEGL